MPRTGKGGPRSGTPGTLYANRSDLAADRQPVRAPAGQTYGDRQQQEQAQQAVPLPDLTPRLEALPGITDPSQRPDEPLPAGLPFGPGPGPSRPTPAGGGGTGLLRRMIAAGNTDPVLFDLLHEAERSEARPPSALM